MATLAQGNIENVIFAGLQCIHLKIKVWITKKERHGDQGDLFQNLTYSAEKVGSLNLEPLRLSNLRSFLTVMTTGSTERKLSTVRQWM